MEEGGMDLGDGFGGGGWIWGMLEGWGMLDGLGGWGMGDVGDTGDT